MTKIETTISSCKSNARAHIAVDNEVSLFGWEGDHLIDIPDGNQVTALEVLEDMRAIINDTNSELESRT